MTHKGEKYSVKMQKYYFCNGTHLLVEHLKNDVQERPGGKFLTSDEIVSYLRYDIEELYQVREGQNVRQTKKEVLDKAVKLFPNNVFLSQKSHGRKNVRIIYRP
jgi:hypothetical protein